MTSSGQLSDKALTKGLRAAAQLNVPVVCLALELDDGLRELPSLSLQFLLEQLASTPERLVVVSSSLGRHLVDLVRNDELLSVIGYDSTSSSLSMGPQISAIERVCNALAPAEALWSLHHRNVLDKEGEIEWGYRPMSGNAIGAVLLASVAARFVVEHRVGSVAYESEEGFKRDFLALLEAGVLYAHRGEELHRCAAQGYGTEQRVCRIGVSQSRENVCKAHGFRRKGQPFILDWLLEYGTDIGEQVLSLAWRALSIEVVDKEMSLHDAGVLVLGALVGIGVEFPRNLLPPILQSLNKKGRFDLPLSQLFIKSVDVWELVYWLESRTDIVVHADLQSETLSPALASPKEAVGTMVSDYFASNPPGESLRGTGVRVAVIGDADCHRLDPKLRFDLGMDILHCSKWASLEEFSNACCMHEHCPTPGGEGVCLMPSAFEIIQEVAPEAELVPIRCAPSTPGRAVGDLATGPLVLAIEHALDKDCQVLLLDVRGMGNRQVERAIGRAVAKGAIVIAPAGDAPSQGGGAKRVLWPARYSDVVAVGGCTEDGSPWEGSCRGPQVDICAMAHAVQVQQLPGQLSSTCASAAIVAAVAAVWIQLEGEAILSTLQGSPLTRSTAFQWVLARLRVVRPAWSRMDEKELCGLLDQTALETLEALPAPSLAELEQFLCSPDGSRIRARQLVPCLSLCLMRLPSIFRQELCTVTVVTSSTVASRTLSPKALLSKLTSRLSSTGKELLLEALSDQRIVTEHMSRAMVEPITGITFAIASRHIIGVERKLDVTAAAGLPAVLAYSSLSAHDERVFFTASHGGVYELFLRFGKWQHTNISLLFSGPRARSLVGPSAVLQWNGKDALRWVFFVSASDRRIRFFHHNGNKKKAKDGEGDTLGWELRTAENVPRVHPDCTWLSTPSSPGECISFVAEHTGEVHHLCLQVTKCTCPAFARMSEGSSNTSSSDSVVPAKKKNLTSSGGSDKRASSGSFQFVTPVTHHTISDENIPAKEEEIKQIAPWIVSSRKLKDDIYDDDVEELTIDATVDEFLATDGGGSGEVAGHYIEGFHTGLFLSLPYSCSADVPPLFENNAFRRGFRAAAASLADESERGAHVEYQMYAKYSHELQWGDLIQISTTSDHWITARRKKKDFHVARHHPDLYPFAKAGQKVFQVHFTDLPGWIMLKAYDGTWVRLDGSKLMADSHKIEMAARFHVVGLSREDEQGGLWSWAPGSAHIQCLREGTPTYMRAQFRSVRVDRAKPKGCETYRIFIRHRLAWSD